MSSPRCLVDDCPGYLVQGLARGHVFCNRCQRCISTERLLRELARLQPTPEPDRDED